MRRALLLCLLPLGAHASLPQTFGVGSRATALGGAFTAQADDFSATFYNPAGLALTGATEVAVAPVWVGADLWVEEPGGPRDTPRDPSTVGYFIGVAGPVGALLDLPELALGLTLYLPWEDVVDIGIPARTDARFFPLYSDRLERIVINPALAYRFMEGLSVGIGLDVFFDLDAPTGARYRRETDHSEQRALEADISRSLDINPAPYAGVLYAPTPALSVGVSYRHEQSARTAGRTDFFFGGDEEASLGLDVLYLSFFSPTELSLGVSVSPTPWLTANVDATWARWSAFEGPHGRTPDPAFEDVFVPHAGLRLGACSWLDVLAGYLYQPSPVPPQSGVSNYLDGDRQVISTGAEVMLREQLGLSVAVHAQLHLLAERETTKDPGRLPDRDPGAPGLQTDEIGFPGYRSGGRMLSLGLTVSWRPSP